MRKWNVYLRGKLIETVYFDRSVTSWEVRDSLMKHDGYTYSITVKEAK